MFELSDRPPKIKGVSSGRTSAAAQRRRLAFEVRTVATLLGRGWIIDLTEERLLIARRPDHPRAPGTIESFHTTVWFRGPKKPRD